MRKGNGLGVAGGDPLWFKDAVLYEVHVRAFRDSDGDGAGDFKGLTEKLDYLRDLGVTAVWVLPFCPSPWKDDGYDISDYNNVHPAYGTLADFKTFLKEAHRRGLRVVTELVINHTSDQHAWFQRARRAPKGSRSRDFYVWTDDPEKYKETRIIFKDFEASNWTWDPVAKGYYWHRFYSHQPDLNFDSPHVRRAVIKAMDFWLDMGVDGLRLDAIPYLYEREGTNCENLPETHAFLKELRAHVDQKYGDRMLLAEANQWPEDAVAYFGDGDECHMSFHFPLMPRLFMALRMEEYLPITDILEQTPPIPDNAQWALFLRNHDELTLEMVTDEERDYMYRVYAHDRQARINLGIRRRLAPLLNNQRRRIELMNALLFSMPGTPVLYYGDEIGMGDNVYLGDRNGVRTPMQWSADRNAGFSRSNPQKLYLPVIIDPEYHYEAVNVEAQQNSPGSLLWYMRRLIALRKQSAALSRGTVEFLHPENRKVLAFVRQLGEERVLVVANLSRFPQAVELDLGGIAGMRPVEMFGRAEFPTVRDGGYVLTLTPHAFYWLSLEPARTREALGATPEAHEAPVVPAAAWEEMLAGTIRPELQRLFAQLLRSRAWFQGRSRVIRAMSTVEAVPVVPQRAYLVLLQIEYGEGDPEFYSLAFALVRGGAADEALTSVPVTQVARLRHADGREDALYSGFWDAEFDASLLEAVSRRRRVRGRAGELVGNPGRLFAQVQDAGTPPYLPMPVDAEQRNTSVAFGDGFMLKMFRRLEEGVNPDVEISRFLSEEARFPHTPRYAGNIEYRRNTGEAGTLAVLHGYVEHQGSAWEYTTDALSRYYEQALAQGTGGLDLPEIKATAVDLLDEELPAAAGELMQSYLESARLMGQRTAELHLALASSTANADFAPEPFTDFYRQGLYHGLLGTTSRALRSLRQALTRLPEETQNEAKFVLAQAVEIKKMLRPVRDERFDIVRTRIHGDYHLGQMLYTGKDFVIIDFEGDVTRALGERRIKRSPLRDVGSMLRSFHYVAAAVLFGQVPGVIVQPETVPTLTAWMRFWSACAGAAYLKGYVAAAEGAPFVPKMREQLRSLLTAYVIDKAAHEILHELEHRPGWVRIPLLGMLDVVGAG